MRITAFVVSPLLFGVLAVFHPHHVATAAVSDAGSMDVGMGQTFEDAVHGMVVMETLTSEQATALLDLVGEAVDKRETETHKLRGAPMVLAELKTYLLGEVAADAMSEDTSMSIQAMLGMIDVKPTYNPASLASADKTKEVILRGRYQAPESFNIYNGIWGYTAPDGKEYALSCNSLGLNIVDVTDPNNLVRKQFIRMPGGDVWRDVATHYHAATGKTYAYVAGQTSSAREDADLWILDLSYLPGKIPENEGFKMVPGYSEDGHTLNVDGGFLFLNTAFSSRGIKIFDLKDDPYNPTYIAQYLGGDGHDSFYKEQVSVGRFRRSVLISSDGWTQRTRFIDITHIRRIYNRIGFFTIRPGSPLIISQSELEIPSYQHSSAVSEDGSTMYMFEELNVFDIAIYDISDVASPVRIGEFQWSGESPTKNSIVHNGRVKGNYLHVAYYTAGYRVFDISNPTAPVEVASFDSYCNYNTCDSDTYGEFDGGWNVYTGLASGNILMNDTDGGMFIFSVQ